jgi:hypothetical protein
MAAQFWCEGQHRNGDGCEVSQAGVIVAKMYTEVSWCSWPKPGGIYQLSCFCYCVMANEGLFVPI